MAISTYDELKDALVVWINQPEIAQSAADFITLAEAQFDRELRHWRMEKRSTAETDGQYLDLPSDWIEAIRLKTTNSGTQPLEFISQADMAERRQSGNDTSGVPQFYCYTGGQIELYPTPSDTYTLEMVYYAKVQALSDANTSNWVLDYNPDAYLYTALLHCAPYLGEDVRIPVWDRLSKEAIASINLESDKARYSGTGLRMKLRSF